VETGHICLDDSVQLIFADVLEVNRRQTKMIRKEKKLLHPGLYPNLSKQFSMPATMDSEACEARVTQTATARLGIPR
jgi:hypothetical protein